MAAILTSLQQSLSAEFGIPADIKFLFKKKLVDGSTDIQEIGAHKCILALASDVFKKGFYGGMEDNGCIEIIDVTKEAFDVMVKFIYDKETDMSSYDLNMLCSIYYLSDKYNIPALEKVTLEAVNSKEIEVENIIDVGTLAIQHAVHEKLANALYEASAQRLSRMFNGQLNKAVDYLREIDAGDSLDPIACQGVLRIMARLKKITPTTAPVCVNCGGFPCITGVKLTRENFVKGAKIRAAGVDIAPMDRGSQLMGPGFGNVFIGVDNILKDWEYCTLDNYVFNCEEVE